MCTIISLVKEIVIDSNELSQNEGKLLKSLDEISKVDPILAYELSSVTQYSKNLDNLNKYLHRMRKVASVEDVENIKDMLIQGVNTEILKSLDGFILEAAKNINKKMVIKVKVKMNKQDEYDLSSLDVKIKQLLSTINS